MYIRRKKLGESGFTLIELLIVIAIIGVMTTIVITSLSNSRAKGRDARRISDIRQLRNAIELYRTNNDFAPAGAGALDGGVALQALVTSNLISSISSDPNRTGSEGYYYKNNNVAGAEVSADSNTHTYAIRFYMERGTSFGAGSTYYCATSRGIEVSVASACTQR